MIQTLILMGASFVTGVATTIIYKKIRKQKNKEK